MKAYRATEVLVRENSWRRRKRLVARKAGGQKGTKGVHRRLDAAPAGRLALAGVCRATFTRADRMPLEWVLGVRRSSSRRNDS